MAYITNLKCKTCGKIYCGTKSRFGFDLCTYCARKEKDRKRRQHYQGLDERLRKVENWIYDYRPPRSRLYD